MLAINLRISITSLPPLFPEFAHPAALHLSVGAESLLAAVPVVCFGVFSGVAAPLARRLGEERVLGAALLLLAAGLLLRGAAPGALLFPGTALAAAAIALLNVLLPSLIKRRRPAQAGLLIGLYLLLLGIGGIIGSLAAVPLFSAAGGGSAGVRLTLGIWALPALAAAALWLPQFRFRTRPGSSASHGVLALGRHALAWQATAFMGLQSLLYYAALSWFPTMFRDRGISAVHAGDLLALMNLGNAVTAMLMPMLAHRTPDQRRLVSAALVMMGAGLTGAAFAPVAVVVPATFLLGLGQGATLGLSIFIFTARAPDPVTSASLSAFGQGGGYLIASTGPLLIGLLHSATGGWSVPVAVLLAVAVLALVSGLLAARDRTLPAAGLIPSGRPA
ncbi:MAG TPA: MFS transporter [Streptosporangiaceae bacterium]